MDITVRPIAEDEVATFYRRLVAGFGGDPSSDAGERERETARFLATVPLDRTACAFDGRDLVGTLATFPFDITVPGATTVPMAGTTMVTVQPTHRRRGALTAMMRDHLDDASARGEPLAGLWASESSIYGRFGFGTATENDMLETSGTRIEVSGSGGGVRLIDPGAATEVIAPIYDAARLTRPGMLSRTTAWWENERLHDYPNGGSGTSTLRVVVHASDAGDDGYALYRQKGAWGDALGNGEIRVAEVVASTPEAHTGLWRFLSRIDLFPRLAYRHLPVDDPLRWKVTEPGRLVRKREEALWVRVLDVVKALNARSYAADGSIRMGIADAFRSDTTGTYDLTVSDGIGACRRSDDAADVRLDIDMLGSLYLGSGHALSAARAGRIAGSEEVVVRLGRMFRGDIDPWCPEIF